MAGRPASISILVALLLAACGTAADPSRTVSPTPSASASSVGAAPSPSVTPQHSPRDASAPPSPPPIAAEPPGLTLEPIATGLDAPINVAAVPDGRLLVNERAGRVIVVDPETGATDVALDIGDRVLGQGEQGLLGFALDPGWPGEPSVYVHYTDDQGRTILSSFATASVEPLRIDPESEVVLLRLDQPYANHNGGQLAFGPDGLLYVGLGDGGSGGDPHGNGQNPDTLLGSILRLDVRGRGDDVPYAIPDDNPFVDGGGAPEVYLYGLRNPWRFSFDRLTGELWIADVGQNAFEEINRVDPSADAGGNLGWNVMEASHCFSVADCSPEGMIGPVSEYGRDAGCSVTGGYVYRGAAIDDLAGWYLFGDYCSGLLFGLPSDAETLTPPRVLLETGVQISSFGEGADGELYLADLDGGALYRIVRAG